MWYLYVYHNQTEIRLGNDELISDIVKSSVDKEIHEFHIRKAFIVANERIGNFSYTFDAIVRNDDKAIFLKVFADPLENLKKA